MQIEGAIWLRSVVEKLAVKHHVDELVEYLDTHDLGDYLAQMPEVHFEVNLQHRTHLIAIEEDLINKLAAIARQEQMPAETLVNKWLGEKVAGYPEARP